MRICQYSFTEMFNNAIEHSEGKNALVKIERTARSVSLTLNDDGIGIFEKIKSNFGLEDYRHAILELAKESSQPIPSIIQEKAFSLRLACSTSLQ